jgi:EpsI family protein
MTTSRLIILLALLLGGLSTVFLLPAQSKFHQPVGIELALPERLDGNWYGRDEKVSEDERKVLGEKTEFARKSYRNARGDTIQASIVLAGADMNTSIHRPEWCLPAQGWTIANSGKVPLQIPGRGQLVATRLSNMRFVPDKATGKPILRPDGTPITFRNLDYYWFVGYDGITESHLSRNLIDIRDRLLHGYNQRWAFMTVASNITENLREDGLNEAETDAMIQGFIQKLVPATHKESVKFH